MKNKNKLYFVASVSVFLCFITMFFTSCADALQKKIDMASTTGTTGLTSLVRTTSEDALDTPSTVSVSKNYSKDTIRVRWSSVENAAYYSVTRAIIDPANADSLVPDESAFTTFTYSGGNSSAYVEGTSLDDVVIDLDALEETALNDDTAVAVNQIPQYKNNYRYYYRIVAMNPSEGYESSEPTEIDENVYGTLYKPADNLRATTGASTSWIKLTWDAVENTSQYLITRTEEEDGTKSFTVATVRGNLSSWQDNITSDRQGTQYYYKVIPVSKSGLQAVESSLAMGYALMAGAPGAPDFKSVSRGTEKTITVSWEGVSATDSDGNVISSSEMYYDVYRSSSADSTMKKMCSTSAGVTSYKETTTQSKNAIITGIYYNYYVMPWYSTETSKVLGAMTATPAEGFLLSAPSAISAQKDTSTGNHVIKFKESIGDTTERALYVYRLYGSETSDGNFTLINGNINNSRSDDGFISVTVKNPSTKFYYVTTYYSETNVESAASDIVEPIPSRVKNVYATRNGFAANGAKSPYDKYTGETSQSNAYGCMPIFITWDASDYDDAEGYNIYASTDPTKGYVKINDTMIPKDTHYYEDKRDDIRPCIPREGTATGYQKTKASKLYQYTFHYYVVQAVNSLNQGETVTTIASDGDYNWGYAALDRTTFLLVYDVSNLYSQHRSKYLSKSGGLEKLPKGLSSTADDKEYIYGLISGQLEYSAAVSISPLGAKIWMHFSNYCDFGIIMPDGTSLPITYHNGDTNTVAKADSSGNMNGTMILAGCLYTGQIEYGKVEIVSEVVGGGYFGIKSGPYDLVYDSWEVSTKSLVTW